VEESIRMTEDRDKWRKYVHGVANPRIEEGYGIEQNFYFSGTGRTISLISVCVRTITFELSDLLACWP